MAINHAKMKWADKAKKFPPALCRLLARDRRHGLSHAQLAERIGIARATVQKITYAADGWEKVPYGVMVRFMEACGVDPMVAHPIHDFMKRRKLAYMANASPQTKKMYNRLMRQLSDLDKAR